MSRKALILGSQNIVVGGKVRMITSYDLTLMLSDRVMMCFVVRWLVLSHVAFAMAPTELGLVLAYCWLCNRLSFKLMPYFGVTCDEQPVLHRAKVP